MNRKRNWLPLMENLMFALLQLLNLFLLFLVFLFSPIFVLIIVCPLFAHTFLDLALLW